MAENPTPKDRAQVAMDGMFDLATIEFSIADQIRSAVEVEIEPRDAYIKFLEDALNNAGTYLQIHGIQASAEDIERGEKFRAAIRARGDDAG